MSLIFKTLFFLFLLFWTHLFLLNEGLWLFQDASYWPKSDREMYALLSQQFHTFTSYGYYLGFDLGLFSFNRILFTLVLGISFYLFGADGSQAAIAILGTTLSFVSFYLFSGIFFKNSNVKYFLSILYAFNPLMYSLQGHTYYAISVPLFIYSFYKFFMTEKKIKFFYLFVNVLAAFIWVSYIRFVQLYGLIIIPYMVYIFLNYKILNIKKIVIALLFYSLAFLPFVYSLLNQFMEKSQTAFFYKNIYGQAVVKDYFFQAFNLFPSITLNLYDGTLWTIIGITFFTFIIFLIASFSKKEVNSFFVMNLFLVLFGISGFGLANIFGDWAYLKVLNVLPALTNAPFFAYYLLQVPLIVLIGVLLNKRIKYLAFFTVLFTILSTFPLLNFNDQQLHSFKINQLPKAYGQYFIESWWQVPEATYYFLNNSCWRAKYMDDQNIPTQCLNFGLHYSPIVLADPRLAAGITYELGKKLYGNTNIDNLRITHNLKNIILPKDAVTKSGPGPGIDKNKVNLINKARSEFILNNLLEVKTNDNFDHYFYKDKDDYDFFIYSPKTIVVGNVNNLFDKPLEIRDLPVILDKPISIPQPLHIDYKISPDEQTKYYLKITGIKEQSFLVQFNQTFNDNWKFKFVNKQTFESIRCSKNPQNFVITNNSYCTYNSNLWDLEKINETKQTAKVNHLMGNILNNAWLVSELPSGDSEVYAMIIYEKQDFFVISIWISFLAMLSLAFLSLIKR